MTDVLRPVVELLIQQLDATRAYLLPGHREADERAQAAIDTARAALAAEPPAPDHREALGARPLLEQVARMGDRIGQHTVGEITAISDRAAAWLAENPPGQPVAIEPRGCPTPGACSCVEPPAPAEPSDFQTLQGIALDMVESLRPIVIPEILGVLRRAIKQPPAPAPAADGAARLRQCPTHGQQPANAWACPECLRELREELARLKAPAADGEREELAALIEQTADSHNGLWPGPIIGKLYRAAALLRQPAPAPVPVPVTERPWERPGWCDAEGRCWWFNRAGIPEWQLADGGPYGDFCLPHWAIPQPPQGGEVKA